MPSLPEGNSGMHRCNGFGCQAYINPHHLHPLFVDARGSSHTSLPTQSALLFLLLNRVPNATIHRILHINHKAIEDMDKRMMQLRKAWVEEKEKLIVFGNGKTWMDIEADEATFTTTDFKDCAEDPAKPVAWEQWCGIIQRGCPQTLLLKRLSPTMFATRSPGPGAIRKVEWKPLATKHLQDRCVVLHTDAAKSYRLRLPGVLHDHVKHCPLQKKGQGQGQMGLEASDIREAHYPQRSQIWFANQNQGWDSDHRSGLAILERQNQVEPKLYSGVSSHADKDP